MTVSITLNGVLKLDQTAGIQDVAPEDDVNLDVTVNPDPASDVLTGSLDSDFLAFLNALSATQVTDAQKAFAALVEGASDPNFVTVTATQGETIGDLFFSDAAGAAFDGDQVFISAGVPLKTTTGQNIYLWSALGGKVVLATTGTASDPVVAAFYIESNNAANTSAMVESVNFIPIAHPDATNPDDTIDFSEILKVSTTASLSFNFDALKSGSSLWAAVGSSTAGVLVTGGNPVVDAAGKKTNASDTIHTSQGGQDATIGVNNQLFDNAGETGVFTLVSGFTNLVNTNGAVGDYVVDPKPNDNKPEGIDYGGYLNVTGAGVFISQSQGNDLKSFDINVLRAGSGTTPEEGFGYISGLSTDAPVNVNTVTVLGAGGTPIATWVPVGVIPGTGQVASGTIVLGVKVEINGNNIDVDGLLNGFTVNWTTTDQFNRFQLVQEGGAFDVGGVNITSGQPISANIGDFLQVDDDGPSVTAGGTVPTLVTDDTEVTDTDTKSFANVFTALYGTDGPLDVDNNGADAGALTYTLGVKSANVDSGLDDAVTGDSILLRLNGTVVEGYLATQTGVLAFTISVDASGNVTQTQLRSVVHNDPADHVESGNSAAKLAAADLVTLTATAKDDDNDTKSAAANIGQSFTFEDDGPSVAVANTTGNYAAGAQGTWTDLPGTDGFDSLGATFDSYQIDAHGLVTTTATNSTFNQTSDFVFEGSITDDFNSDGTDDTVEFTLTFNPGSDSYDLQVTVPPESVVDISTADGSLAAGGPDPVQTLTIGDTDIVFSAVVPTTDSADIAPFLNQTEAFIEANADYLSDDEMNVSTAGIGNDNNNFDGNADSGIDGNVTAGGKVDESFVVDPELDVSSMKVFIAGSGGPSYNPGTEELFYLVYDEDGNAVGSPTKVEAGDLTTEADGRLSFVIGDPNGSNVIDAVQLFMGTGSVKIPEIQFTVTTVFDPEPLNLDFTATLVDGDGDSHQDGFSVGLVV